MRKTYILDTNVLLHDPHSLARFVDNDVLIPIAVIEEIDRFKREQSDRGQNAREVSRWLDSLRNGQGPHRRSVGDGAPQSLAQGVQLDTGVRLQVYWDQSSPAGGGQPADTHILQIARSVQARRPDVPVIIVTKDINLRIRADAMGLRAEDYESDRVVLSDIFDGQAELTIDPATWAALDERQVIPQPAEPRLDPNQYVLVRSANDAKKTLLARVEGASGKLHRIPAFEDGVCGIKPRNKEQYFALDALLDDRIKMVTVMGKAGTGKTLLALACALHQVLVKKRYRGLMVARPTVSVGKEIGYLPGGIEEKMAPWMRPITDTLEFLFDTAKSIGGHHDYRTLWNNGTIEIQSLSLIRGRSISNHYIVVDEAQNLSPLEVKTVITRVGHASKVVLTGDPYQIDNPYVDSGSNGFNYLVNRFRKEPIAAHIALHKGERSELAELAANLL